MTVGWAVGGIVVGTVVVTGWVDGEVHPLMQSIRRRAAVISPYVSGLMRERYGISLYNPVYGGGVKVVSIIPVMGHAGQLTIDESSLLQEKYSVRGFFSDILHVRFLSKEIECVEGLTARNPRW
jgi:hypothetical protein